MDWPHKSTSTLLLTEFVVLLGAFLFFRIAISDFMV